VGRGGTMVVRLDLISVLVILKPHFKWFDGQNQEVFTEVGTVRVIAIIE
jgi:hypothetical protein